MILLLASNKDANQLEHLQSLISTFVILSLGSKIVKLLTFKISIFCQNIEILNVSVAEKAGLRLIKSGQKHWGLQGC